MAQLYLRENTYRLLYSFPVPSNCIILLEIHYVYNEELTP